MVLARLQREGRRDREHLGSAQRQQPVELREAHVVADREAELRSSSLRGHDLPSGGDGFALQVLAVRGLHVEEVDLAVDRRHLPVRPEKGRGVVEPIRAGLAFEDRAAEHVDPKLLCQGAEKVRRRAGHGLGVLPVDLVQPVAAKELGQRDKLGARGYRRTY